MRNYIYIFILIISSNIYAQSGIENDELYIKYEQEYLKLSTSPYGREYELANKNFYSKFNNYKEKTRFNKTKDKERWLSKNFSKTDFGSVEEALEMYKNFVVSKQKLDNINNNVKDIRTELLKTYDVNLIWETLQTRIKKMK